MYRVLAPLVLAKDQEGQVRYHYRDAPNIGEPLNYGATIPWLSDAQAEQFLLEGQVERIDDEPVDTAQTGPDPLQDCLKALEMLGVELSAGAPTAREALRAGGYRYGNDIVAAAVKARKEALRALSGTAA
jgi:cytochrome c oxidase cbb3-type subunit II